MNETQLQSTPPCGDEIEGVARDISAMARELAAEGERRRQLPDELGTAIYDDSPLQRRFRDAHTATAHFQVNEASRELPGRILLGQPADPAML